MTEIPMPIINKGSNSVLIILERGEPLVSTLTTIITQEGTQGGWIVGVGALQTVELGYYELDKQTYKRHTFTDENYELLSLNGNIASKDNVPVLHIHSVLGRSDFSTFGGHLFEGIVAVTAEITIFPLGKMPRRVMNTKVGLPLICGF